MSKAVSAYLLQIIATAEAGVDYRPAPGPCAGCLLASSNTTIKSVEVDR